jgi:drug efflux transport system ATP-binding protein
MVANKQSSRQLRLHMPDSVIVLNHLSKTFGAVDAVKDLSFSIAPGVIFGFLGANGAGKTTTMRMLCGLTHPTSGNAAIMGHDVWKQRHRARACFGYVAQRFSLYPDLTVEENFRFFGGASRVAPGELEQRIRRLLRSTDLSQKQNTPAGSLSGGMRQLLAVGCALIHDPPLLFLDEPTSGLDPVHRQQIWDLLYDLSNEGKTIFVTTHYMDEAERCTEVGFLESGRLLAEAPPRDLKLSFRTKLLELDVDPVMPALVQFRTYPGVLGVSLRSGSLRIYAPDPENLLANWKKDWPARDVRFLRERWVEPDMEDVFTAYSQGYNSLLKNDGARGGAPEKAAAESVPVKAVS